LLQIIHIKRFRYNAIRREKMNTDVKFPAAGLDLKSYLSTDSVELSKLCSQGGDTCPPPVYDLAGVANHSGGMNGGHYIAHVDGSDDPATKRDLSSDKDWLCFNDNRVSQSSISSAGGSSAYMLFYRRRDDNIGGSKTIQI
jgi:ubiquitin C-terminal hydrolase